MSLQQSALFGDSDGRVADLKVITFASIEWNPAGYDFGRFQWCNWELSMLVIIEIDIRLWCLVQLVQISATLPSKLSSARSPEQLQSANAFFFACILQCWLMTYNQSDSAVGRTLSETTECWRQTERGGCIRARVEHFKMNLLYRLFD